MDAAVLCKTDQGRDEIQHRSRKLAPGMRSILLMVDGQRTGSELASIIEGLHAPADALDQLAALGLVVHADKTSVHKPGAQPAAERYIALYTLMSDSIRAHLGLKGYFLQLKVERCADAAELAALLPEMATALGKARGPAFATHWMEGARSL